MKLAKKIPNGEGKSKLFIIAGSWSNSNIFDMLSKKLAVNVNMNIFLNLNFENFLKYLFLVCDVKMNLSSENKIQVSIEIVFIASPKKPIIYCLKY